MADREAWPHVGSAGPSGPQTKRQFNELARDEACNESNESDEP